MLQLQTKEADISRISKVLVKHRVKASIANQVITLDGEISEELLSKLYSEIGISTVQNYKGESNSSKIIPIQSRNEHPQLNEEEQNLADEKNKKYDLLYSEVKRGEIYWCDFGEPYGSEQGYRRPALVIQNDVGNKYSNTTIVVPITTRIKKLNSADYVCILNKANVLDYNPKLIRSEPMNMLFYQIRTVDKSRLRKYMCTLHPKFMEILQEKIDVSLSLDRDLKPAENKENSQENVDKSVFFSSYNGPKDVNIVQIKLLSLVNINDLIKISQSSDTRESKTLSILELFGFDFKKNGVNYLIDAINTSLEKEVYTLETLCESISNNNGIPKDEIHRVIVARVKEQFSSVSKKAPTMDFIRLVKSFLA